MSDGSDMRRVRNIDAGGARYAYPAITAELRRALGRAPRGTADRVAQLVAMDGRAFQGRLDESGGLRFTYEELGVIAEGLGAPPGWPLLSWDVAEALGAILQLALVHKEGARLLSRAPE